MIEGRVVRIVDDQMIVVNVGAGHGVKYGMEFVVVQPMEGITDPDTGDDLGTWEMVKARLIVMHVQPKLSTLVPLPSEKSQTTVLSQRLAWNSHGAPAGSQDVSLAVDRAQMSGRRRVEAIRVGDPVRSVAT